MVSQAMTNKILKAIDAEDFSKTRAAARQIAVQPDAGRDFILDLLGAHYPKVAFTSSDFSNGMTLYRKLVQRAQNGEVLFRHPTSANGPQTAAPKVAAPKAVGKAAPAPVNGTTKDLTKAKVFHEACAKVGVVPPPDAEVVVGSVGWQLAAIGVLLERQQPPLGLVQALLDDYRGLT